MVMRWKKNYIWFLSIILFKESWEELGEERATFWVLINGFKMFFNGMMRREHLLIKAWDESICNNLF